MECSILSGSPGCARIASTTAANCPDGRCYRFLQALAIRDTIIYSETGLKNSVKSIVRVGETGWNGTFRTVMPRALGLYRGKVTETRPATTSEGVTIPSKPRANKSRFGLDVETGVITLILESGNVIIDSRGGVVCNVVNFTTHAKMIASFLENVPASLMGGIEVENGVELLSDMWDVNGLRVSAKNESSAIENAMKNAIESSNTDWINKNAVAYVTKTLKAEKCPTGHAREFCAKWYRDKVTVTERVTEPIEDPATLKSLAEEGVTVE